MNDLNFKMDFGDGGSVDKLVTSLDELKASIEAVNVVANKMGQRMADVNKAVEDSANAGADGAKKQGAETEKQIGLLRQLRDRLLELKKARLDATSVSEIKRYNAEIQDTTQKIRTLTNETRKMAAASDAGFKQMTSVFNKLGAVLGISFGAYGAFRVLVDVIKGIAEFELAMKKLQSVTAATEYQMDSFIGTALLVGSNSIYGAKGVAEVMTELAKMGFAAKDIEAMTQGIVDLATATQEPLEKSSETVANVIRAWGLAGKDTAAVVDAMAVAFAASALDLERFRQSIKYIAPIARAANFSLEETSALLGVLADRGIYGSMAGTGLRNIFLKMVDANSELAKKTGITVRSFDDMIRVLRILKSEGTSLTDVLDVVDTRASTPLKTLIDGVDELEQMNNKIRASAGESGRMAGVQMESLTNKFKLMKEAWRGFVLDVDSGDSLLSQVLKLLVDLSTETAKSLTLASSSFDGGMQKKQGEEIRQLINIYSDLNSREIVREKAMKRLIELAPEYFTGIEKEADAVNAAATAYSKYLKEQQRAADLARLKAASSKIHQKILEDEAELMELLMKNTKWGVAIRERGLKKLYEEYKKAEEAIRSFYETEYALEERVEMADVSKEVKGFGDQIASMAADLVGRGVPANIAFERALDSVNKQIDETRSGLKEERRLLALRVAGGEQLTQQMTDISFKIMLLDKAQKELARSAVDQKTLFEESYWQEESLIKLRQKSAELKAMETNKGIALEKKLAKIRYEYGVQAVMATTDAGEERNLLLGNLRRQYLIDLKNINNKEIAENLKKTQEIFRQEQELNKLKEALDLAYIESKYFGASRAEQINNLQHLNNISRLENEYEQGVMLTQARLAQGEINEREFAAELERLYNELEMKKQAVAMNTANKTRDINARILQEQVDNVESVARLEKEKALAAIEQDGIKFRAVKRNAKETEAFEKQSEGRRLIAEKEYLEAKLFELQLTRDIAAIQGLDPDAVKRYSDAIAAIKIQLETIGVKINTPEVDTAKLTNQKTLIKQLVGDITSSIRDMVNEWVQATTAIVNEIDRRISAAESALQTELQLAERGYANNVSIKRKELEDVQVLREKAVRDQQAAAKAQLHIDSATQASNLTTTASVVFKEGVKAAGLPGILFAVAGIASIFAMMQRYKLQAKQFSTQSYGRGGYGTLGGRRHTSGGVNLGALGEGESGEAWGILNRRASMKYGDLFHEFVANANIGRLDPSLFPKFGDVRVKSTVNLDEGKYIRGIHRALTRKKNEAEYGNGYRIVRRGGIVERYWMS